MGPQSLDLLLMCNPELLLFIDHKQTQVLKLHFFPEERMCTDNDVDLPLLQQLERFLFFLCRLEPVDKVHPNGEILQAVAEGLIVLKSQNGRWDKYRRLLVVAASLEGRAD